MRTTAASGLIALTALLGAAASMTVAGPATAALLPTTAAPAKAPPPANQLYGVSCPSSTYCVAVGINENAEVSVKGGGALIQTWNGRTWTSTAPKAPKGALSAELLAVSCATAKSCVAVGLYLNSGGVGVPLAETWNGKAWTPGTPARPAGSSGGQLDNVSCRTADSCVAVGTSSTNTADFALAEAWNGKTWSRMSVQPPASGKDGAELTGVSCTSAASCVAVGFADADFDAGGHTGRAAATSWNGRTWTAAAVPAPGKGKAGLFNAVSCPATAECVAVGQLGPYNSDEGSDLAGVWNGRGWRLATTP